MAGRALVWLRAAFLIAALGFAVFAFRKDGPAILEALSAITTVQLLLAALLTVIGTAATSFSWIAIVRAYGHQLALLAGFRIFFIGQLGKYIPGSVWSFVAQAEMASGLAIPTRTTIAAGFVFLSVSLSTSLLMAGLAALGGGISFQGGTAMVLAAVAASLVVLSPSVLAWVARCIASERWVGSHPIRRTLKISGPFAITWPTYGLAVTMLLPPVDRPTALQSIGAAAAAYFVGVLVVVAPAGLGIREVVMTILLTPAVGVAPAAAAALLSRLLATVVDFGAAAASWLLPKWLRPTVDAPGKLER